MLSSLEFDFKWFVDYVRNYIKSIACYLHLNFLLFHIWSQYLHILWLWEFQSLATYGTTGATYTT